MHIVIVGAGAIGLEMGSVWRRLGARVTVVSPEATPQLEALAAEGRIRLHRRPYTDLDMEGVFLVFGTTDNRELNRRISEDAQRLGVWCNIADQPDRGQFVLPAVVSRGDLLISIATSRSLPTASLSVTCSIRNASEPLSRPSRIASVRIWDTCSPRTCGVKARSLILSVSFTDSIAKKC